MCRVFVLIHVAAGTRFGENTVLQYEYIVELWSKVEAYRVDVKLACGFLTTFGVCNHV